MVDFLKTQPPETKINYRIGFKETTVSFNNRELTVTNFPEHEVVDGLDIVTDKIIVRFWENDKQVDVELPDIDDLIEQTKLTEQEKEEFLKVRFNSMLAWFIKVGRNDNR